MGLKVRIKELDGSVNISKFAWRNFLHSNIKHVSQIQGVFILIDFFLGYIKLDFIITDYLNKRRFNETF